MKKYLLLTCLLVLQTSCFAAQPATTLKKQHVSPSLSQLSTPELEHLIQEFIIKENSCEAAFNIGPILSLGLVAAALLLLYQITPVNGSVLDSLNVIDWVRCAGTMTEECVENFFGDTMCETICEINDFCWAFIKDGSITDKICAITSENLENL